MYTALASLFLGKKVRPDVAMTGEVTLRGLVLPIGGVKEKVIAAQRAGIKTVILPERNRKDLSEIREDVRKLLTFEFAATVEDVLRVAFRDKGPAGRPGTRSGHGTNGAGRREKEPADRQSGRRGKTVAS
jgi:ATP-dependent Lon protease